MSYIAVLFYTISVMLTIKVLGKSQPSKHYKEKGFCQPSAERTPTAFSNINIEGKRI